MRGLLNPLRRPFEDRAFTLLELLVASTVLSLIVVMLFSVISQTSETLMRSRGHIDSFQSARTAYELLTRNLSQATLNTHWRYDDPNNPTRYLRASDLHFVIEKAGPGVPGTAGSGFGAFFQAPTGVVADDSLRGLNTVLNGLGYYVEFASDADFRPSIITDGGTPQKHRYRLMQMRIPSEELDVYTTAGDFSWFNLPAHKAWSYPVSDNIILLVVWPRLPVQEDSEGDDLSQDFTYDSRLDADSAIQPRTANQLPPVLEVLMVAIDETSALRLADSSATEPPVIKAALEGKFQTSTQAAFETDLDQLEAALLDANVKYSIFRSAIPMRESKWSEF